MIGLYGGTFDPIHFGHLRTALDVQQILGLDQLRFLPCGVPPHRPAPAASPAQRLAMVREAVRNEPGLQVDNRELQRPGPSYMVDTLQSLRDELGARSLGLILGMDAFRALETWHRWQHLLDLAHLIVMQRPGARAPAAGALEGLVRGHRATDGAELRARPAGGILFLPVRQLDISATEIRQLLARGESPRYLLPDGVLELIRAQQLYGT
jgi:nicotinate-nucleotide adenylyltransferase